MRLFFIAWIWCIGQIQAQESLVKSVLTAIRPPYFILNDGRDSIKIEGLAQPKNQLIFMVFHAEQDDIGLDPGLSTDGRWRAIQLMNIFKNLSLESYLTTPFRNNILTLQPITDQRSKPLSYYDQADLKSLFKQVDLMESSDLLMVVHQQTISQLIEQWSYDEWNEKWTSQPTDLIFIIDRSPGQKGKLYSFTYKIRS